MLPGGTLKSSVHAGLRLLPLAMRGRIERQLQRTIQGKVPPAATLGLAMSGGGDYTRELGRRDLIVYGYRAYFRCVSHAK